MKKSLIFALAMTAQVAMAGSGPATGGATEATQMLNKIQLVMQYEQQVEQYVRQGLQYEAQLKELMQNPSSSLSGDAADLIQKIGRIMSAGQAMGGTIARIDSKFAETFKSPQAATFSENFSKWTTVSKDTLEGSLRSAGLRRDQYASEADALQALYNESQKTGGNLSALQTLAKINIKQVQQTQALGDLMAAQNIAASTHMATQASKGQAAQDNNDAIQNGFEATKPPATKLGAGTQTYKKFNFYTK